MICVGVQAGVVTARLNCPDTATYNQFAPFFDVLIDTTGYTAVPDIGWVFDGGTTFNYGQLSAVPSVKITKLAFESRLLPTEEGTILGFALANIMAYYTTPTNPLFVAACQVLVLLRRQANATYVDLYRADTQLGVGAMVSLNLISSARATAILTTPPALTELYQG